MKQKIIFTRIIKRKSQINWEWSGSVNGLVNAFKKRTKVIEYRFYWDFNMKIHKALEKIGIIPYDFEVYNLQYTNKKVKLPELSAYPIIQFGEFPNSANVHSYIYQDLSISYIAKIEQERSLGYEFSGFGYISKRALNRRLKLQQSFYKNAVGVFTMSHWLHSYLLMNGIVPKEKLKCVGGGVNLDINRIDSSNKHGNKILFVGKDFLRKGGDLVYDAFCVLNSQFNPDAELYIAGPQSLPIEITNKNVHFVGEKTSEELVDYFNVCDIFVMPSRFEAYGLVFIEALTFGLPCIGRNCYEMPYFIEEGKTGYLIENDEPVVLAKKMDSLLKDDVIRNNVYCKRNEYIREYSWDAVCDKMLSFINKKE